MTSLKVELEKKLTRERERLISLLKERGLLSHPQTPLEIRAYLGISSDDPMENIGGFILKEFDKEADRRRKELQLKEEERKMELEATGLEKKEIYSFVYGKETRQIHIHFLNDKFSRIDFYLKGVYGREEWKILALIDAKISEIERKKNGQLFP